MPVEFLSSSPSILLQTVPLRPPPQWLYSCHHESVHIAEFQSTSLSWLRLWKKYSSYGGKKESTNKFMMIYWAKKADPIKDQSKANQMWNSSTSKLLMPIEIWYILDNRHFENFHAVWIYIIRGQSKMINDRGRNGRFPSYYFDFVGRFDSTL